MSTFSSLLVSSAASYNSSPLVQILRGQYWQSVLFTPRSALTWPPSISVGIKQYAYLLTFNWTASLKCEAQSWEMIKFFIDVKRKAHRFLLLAPSLGGVLWVVHDGEPDYSTASHHWDDTTLPLRAHHCNLDSCTSRDHETLVRQTPDGSSDEFHLAPAIPAVLSFGNGTTYSTWLRANLEPCRMWARACFNRIRNEWIFAQSQSIGRSGYGCHGEMVSTPRM